MNVVEIVHTSDDGLSREVWYFGFMDYRYLVLNGYEVQTRLSKRQKHWNFTHQYQRAPYGRHPGKILTLAEVPYSSELEEEALAAFVSQIKVAKTLE